MRPEGAVGTAGGRPKSPPPGGEWRSRAEVGSLGAGQSRLSSSRSVMYLTITGAEMCGMSLSGPILASCAAARK